MFDIIFTDLDGPILDGKLRHYQCYKDIINKFGGDLIGIESYWEMKRSKTSRVALLEMSNFKASYQTFFDEWMQNIEAPDYLKLDILQPKVIETLTHMHALADKIILVTMRQHRFNLLSQLESLDILSYFDEVIDCPPTRENTKYNALKNIPFTRALFIGDTEEDTKTAKMLNIKSIGITTGLRKKELLDADYYHKYLSDINFKLTEQKIYD